MWTSSAPGHSLSRFRCLPQSEPACLPGVLPFKSKTMSIIGISVVPWREHKQRKKLVSLVLCSTEPRMPGVPASRVAVLPRCLQKAGDDCQKHKISKFRRSDNHLRLSWGRSITVKPSTLPPKRSDTQTGTLHLDIQSFRGSPIALETILKTVSGRCP